MAGRPIKEGLDYYPMDVDFFEDDKIQFVSSRFEAKGELIAVKLLCKIYKEKGYYYQWGEDEALLFAKRVGNQHTLVNDVVQELVKRDFFDKNIFNSFKILTSKGIQKRYTNICTQAKRKFKIDDRFNLLEQKKELTPKELELTPNILPITHEVITQSKVKESKEKKSDSDNTQKDLEIFEKLKFEIINSERWIRTTHEY